MGFIIHFYTIFGTSLLTGGPVQIVVFLPISGFCRKGISNGVQTEWNLRESRFWNKRNLGDLEWTSRKQRGGHEAGRRAPHLHGPLVAPLTDFFRLYVLIYPENIREHHETLFPPLRESRIRGCPDSWTTIIDRTPRLWRYKIEDFVPCPDGTFLGVEGKLGDTDT